MAQINPAYQRLQDHCDYLNGMGWVRASGKPYLVAKTEDGRLAVIREGERRA